MSRHLALGALVFFLFGCDSDPPERCNHEGCGSYHGGRFDSKSLMEVKGTLAIPVAGRSVTLPDARFESVVADDGTIDVYSAAPGRVLRAHLALQEAERGVHGVHGEVWLCASETAKLDAIATDDGNAAVGCFERGADVVPALREPVSGTIEVFASPIDTEVAYAEDSAFGIHYRIDTKEGSAATAHVDVVSWRTSTVVECGGVY